MIRRYRKRPVEVDALLFDGENLDEVRDWLGDAYLGVATMSSGPKRIRIVTYEGVITASRGDWIIKGVEGEFYPCKPGIFAETYEPVVGRGT